jgi:hypothetical protein
MALLITTTSGSTIRLVIRHAHGRRTRSCCRFAIAKIGMLVHRRKSTHPCSVEWTSAVLARTTGSEAAGTLLTLAVLAAIGYVLLRPFRRRKGGAGGGSEKAIVGALFLVAAIILGLAITGR